MRILLIALFISILLPTTAVLASDYTYIEAAELHERLTAQQAVIILDIQFSGAYEAAHFPAAIATYAYPLKTPASRAAIDKILPQLTGDDRPIIIVSHRGGGGAMRTSDYLQKKGISAARIAILRKGMQAWPYLDMVEASAK